MRTWAIAAAVIAVVAAMFLASNSGQADALCNGYTGPPDGKDAFCAKERGLAAKSAAEMEVQCAQAGPLEAECRDTWVGRLPADVRLDEVSLAAACQGSESCRVRYLSQHIDDDPLVTVARCAAEAAASGKHCAELVMERWFREGPSRYEVQAVLSGATESAAQVGYWAGRAAFCAGDREACPKGTAAGEPCTEGMADQERQAGGCPAH